MTTDKPGAEAMEAALQVSGADAAKNAAIIQAAIDEATAAVVAERDKLDRMCQGIIEGKEQLSLEYAETIKERDDARAAARELGGLVKRCRDICLFDDDDGQIGVAEDVVIEGQLFRELCANLRKHAPLLAEPEGGG